MVSDAVASARREVVIASQALFEVDSGVESTKTMNLLGLVSSRVAPGVNAEKRSAVRVVLALEQLEAQLHSDFCLGAFGGKKNREGKKSVTFFFLKRGEKR